MNLRGIGSGDTLVLLNGRRVANYAFDGSAVDVNSIPLAAVERVEILKDGASAIYGTDAVAGVVNFILRKDYKGFEITGFGSWPQQGGGEQYQAFASAGFGDLAKDKYNVFVTAAYQKDEPLMATERAFSRTAYRPEEGLFQLPPLPFPANIYYPPTDRLTTGLRSASRPVARRRIAPQRCQLRGTHAASTTSTYSMIVPQVERTAVSAAERFQATPIINCSPRLRMRTTGS